MTNLSVPLINRIELLGTPSITIGDHSIPTSEPLVFVTALYLCLNRGQAIRRTHLAALLWPDVLERARSERFRQLVLRLKRFGIPVPHREPEIRLEADSIAIDVDALARATSVAEVIALVRGDVLQGFDAKLSDLMSRWLEDTRDSLRASVIRLLEGWLSASARSGNWYDTERLALLMLAVQTDHASARRALAEARRMQEGTDPWGSLPQVALPVGVRSTRAHLEVSPVHLSPLVGREALLARLLDAVEAPGIFARRIAIAGPSGIGKTRLLDELGAIARVRRAQVARLRCGRADGLRPLSLVVDLARALLRMRGALGASSTSLEVLRRFTGEDATITHASSNEVRRAALFESLSDLVGALTDEQRLVVVIDDAQWAELGSWPILAPIFAQDPASWVVSIRTDTREECTKLLSVVFPPDGASAEQTRDVHWLAPLRDTDIHSLCTARALPRALPPDAAMTLGTKAAGIPFIAEALVDHWLVTGDAASLPITVNRIVEARLDRLSPAGARVLAAVAILGLDAVFPALEAVATIDRNDLLVATRELETAGVTRTVEGLLTAHALWTEAILRRTTRSTTLLLHRYAAEWLQFSATMMEVIEPRRHWAIVTHWVGADEPGRARLELEHAANRLSANGFAAKAARMLEHRPDSSRRTPT